jgi:hypothetical protein
MMTIDARRFLLSFLVLLAWLTAGSAAASEPIRVLFVGNSYTFYNRLPELVRQMSLDARQQRPLEVKDVTFGYATLEAHWQKGDVQQALAGRHYDYVVIQDHSLGPIDHPDLTRKYVKLIAAEARKAGAQPILYMTWARQHKPEMQKQLEFIYTSVAQENQALLAPVGLAWQRALAETPRPELYIKDGSHPSYLGSYLAASVFYALIYGARPPAAPAGKSAAIDQAVAAVLQQDAWRTVQAEDIALRTPPTGLDMMATAKAR